MSDIPIELVKAIWASGFRAGRENGSDEAFCSERGCVCHKPQDSEKAWVEDVEWRLNTDTSFNVDPANPAHWGDVP